MNKNKLCFTVRPCKLSFIHFELQTLKLYQIYEELLYFFFTHPFIIKKYIIAPLASASKYLYHRPYI